jgi:hypothetical protein
MEGWINGAKVLARIFAAFAQIYGVERRDEDYTCAALLGFRWPTAPLLYMASSA